MAFLHWWQGRDRSLVGHPLDAYVNPSSFSAFLYHGKNVTPAQQEMFSIIPRVFYSTYHCTFGQAFTTVHSFIYYGTSTLANAPQAIQAIIEISIANMNTK